MFRPFRQDVHLSITFKITPCDPAPLRAKRARPRRCRPLSLSLSSARACARTHRGRAKRARWARSKRSTPLACCAPPLPQSLPGLGAHSARSKQSHRRPKRSIPPRPRPKPPFGEVSPKGETPDAGRPAEQSRSRRPLASAPLRRPARARARVCVCVWRPRPRLGVPGGTTMAGLTPATVTATPYPSQLLGPYIDGRAAPAPGHPRGDRGGCEQAQRRH